MVCANTHLKGVFCILSPHTQPSPLAIESTNIALIGFLVALFINLWKYLSKPTFIKCFKLVSFLVGMWLIVHWLDKRKQLPKMFPSQPFWRPQSLAKNCDRYLFWIHGFIAPPANYWNQKDFQWLVEHQGKARKCQCESHPQASHQPSQVLVDGEIFNQMISLIIIFNFCVDHLFPNPDNREI